MTNKDKTAEKAFDAFANRYDHESNEWLDMDVQTFFQEGFKAALESRVLAESDKQEAAYNCGECACLPGFCDEEGSVRSVLRLIVNKIDEEGPASRDWQGFTHLCELAKELLDSPKSDKQEAVYREVGVWEPDGKKFTTYRKENLNGKAMYVLDKD